MTRRCLILLLLAGCVRTTPQPPPEPLPASRPVVVPPGCLEALGGKWIHSSDRSFRYEAQDDGGTLTLIVSRVGATDAGFSPRRFRPVKASGVKTNRPALQDAGPEPSSVRIELKRTEHGFVGETLSPLAHPTGRTCEGRFPTQVLNCADAGLLLETQSATALGDACQAPVRPLGLLTQKHQLVRPDAG